MDEKWAVGIVAAAAISPICAVCILGPAAIASLFAGAFGWLGGFGPLAAAGLMIAAGAFVYRQVLRNRTRSDSRSDAAGNQLRSPAFKVEEKR